MPDKKSGMGLKMWEDEKQLRSGFAEYLCQIVDEIGKEMRKGDDEEADSERWRWNREEQQPNSTIADPS